MPNDDKALLKLSEIRTRTVIISFLLSLISIKGLSLVLPTYQKQSFQRIQPKSFLWIILFFLLWIGLSILISNLGLQDKKLAMKLTFFYSTCNILGYFYKTYGGVTVFWHGINDTINFICYLIGYGCMTFSFILFILWGFQTFSIPNTGKIFQKSWRKGG